MNKKIDQSRIWQKSNVKKNYNKKKLKYIFLHKTKKNHKTDLDKGRIMTHCLEIALIYIEKEKNKASFRLHMLNMIHSEKYGPSQNSMLRLYKCLFFLFCFFLFVV